MLLEKYRKYTKSLSIICKDGYELNIRLLQEINNREEICDQDFVFISILGKICQNINSILTLLPKDHQSQLIGTEDFKILDLSSIASLVRDAMEASNILFYLFREEVNEDEREFRLLLFNLHGRIRSKEFSELAGLCNSDNPNETTVKINQIIKALESNIFFTHGEITEKRGMDLSKYKALQIFLSSHTHSFSMGTSLVPYSAIHDDKSMMFLIMILGKLNLYFVLTIIDVTRLFPEMQQYLTPQTNKIITNILQN